jgi:predicted transposase YbfD/YdcC
MVIYGILNGHDCFDSIAFFLKQNEIYFKNLLLLRKTPSHDCLSDLFSVINPEDFMNIFIEWVSDIVERKTGEIIAIDGKAVRAARDKINGGNTPYILSAYLSEIGISIGQVGVGKKSNEITSIPDLLKILDIEGCYITTDAMGTQENIANKIVTQKGHFVLKVKNNQPTLFEDLRNYFSTNGQNSKTVETSNTELEKKHGREEYREYYISTEIDCISHKEKWKTVESIGMIRVYRKTKEKEEINEHYYIMDTKISMDMFKKTTRNHWNIECGLHWRLDVILNEDRSRNRVGHSISNLSIIRKIVFNLIKSDHSFAKLSFKKKMIMYQSDFANIENLLFEVIPQISA